MNYLIIDLDKIGRAIKLIKTLNHPIRKKYLDIMDNHPFGITVTELQIKSRTNDQSKTSQHLKWFRDAGVVNTEREGKNIWYTINKDAMIVIQNMIIQLSETEGINWTEKAFGLLRAIHNKNNFEVLFYVLANEGSCVGLIYETLGLEQAVCSQRLCRLKRLGLVYSANQGKLRHYHPYKVRLNSIMGIVDNALSKIDELK